MEVWVVEADQWNGEYGSVSTAGVFSSEEKARAYVDAMNAKRTSDYSTEYSISDSGFVIDGGQV